MIEFGQKQKPQDLRYNIKCKVVCKEVSYTDEQSTGIQTTREKLVFLIPQLSTQMELFYAAWLPESSDEPVELVCQCGHPVYSTFRAALWRRTQHVGDIHLFVMSKGAEEAFKQMKETYVNLEILGQQEDTLADNQRDWELAYNKNKKTIG